MNNFLKLSALAAVALATAYASADVISIASGNVLNTTFYKGYTQGTGGATGPYNDLNPSTLDIANAANSATIADIGTGGVWTVPIPGATWTSFTNSQPGGVVVANGYYDFQTSFTTTGAGIYTGTLSVEADDTVAVLLNGQQIIAAGAVGTDGHCGVNVPNCNSVDTISFGTTTPGFLNNGVNVLSFIVEQTGSSAMGLDYAALTQTPVVQNAGVPEPSTLLMLGTGLIGGAGSLFRRMREA